MKRSFLKWVGGKYRLLDDLKPFFPEGDVFVDLFAGSGVVSLNVDYPHYVLNDTNKKLIKTLEIIRNNPEGLITALRFAFSKPTEKHYREMRDKFNSEGESDLTYAVCYIYLNRYGFNGLSRFNSKGKFNVPYGHLKRKPYCPIDEIKTFASFLERDVLLSSLDFRDVLTLVKNSYPDKKIVVYADPPYAPLSKTANFTSYCSEGFTQHDHRDLAKELISFAEEVGATVILSNTDNLLVREIYHGFDWLSIEVQRPIAAKVESRKPVNELIGVYSINENNQFEGTVSGGTKNKR